jgi:hypothetical protein
MKDSSIPFKHLAADERIKMPHLCLYAVLYQVWERGNFINPVIVKRKEIMLLVKINAKTTYHKCLKELERYAYIKYNPSYHSTGKTEVYLLSIHY